MKILRRLPWQIKFGLFAPVLVLVVLSAAHGSRVYYEWRIRQAVEQALDSFDPETTEFTIFAQDWLNGIETRPKTSAQQRRIVGQWIDSFRYDKAFTQGYSGGGPYVWVEFDSPYGAVGAHRITSLETSHEIRKPFGAVYHDSFAKIFYKIEADGLSAPGKQKNFEYVAEFDTAPLGDELWEIVMEKPHWFFPPMNEQ